MYRNNQKNDKLYYISYNIICLLIIKTYALQSREETTITIIILGITGIASLKYEILVGI